MGTFSPPEFRLRSQSEGSEGGTSSPATASPGRAALGGGGSGLQPRAAGTGGGRGRTSAVHGSHEVPAVRPAPQLLLQVEAPGADDLLHVRDVLVVPPPAQGSLQNTKREESAQNRGGGHTHTVSEPPRTLPELWGAQHLLHPRHRCGQRGRCCWRCRCCCAARGEGKTPGGVRGGSSQSPALRLGDFHNPGVSIATPEGAVSKQGALCNAASRLLPPCSAQSLGGEALHPPPDPPQVGFGVPPTPAHGHPK